MLEKIFNSQTNILLNKAMDAASLRNDVIANNIANVDTPKFKRTEVIFEENMKKLLNDVNEPVAGKLNVTNAKHIQIMRENDGKSLDEFQPETRILEDLSFRNDENNVDIDTEMAKNTKNKINYDALGQSMSNEIKILRMAITGRG
ncbi:MAG: flagellar basal body rod protein FlgB [Syntrophomonadaceae bacterium]|nr:flagellar basal body rod protein FlgB [Syntrophomonadaceae bacterium]MDD3023434.1 flagellar basal body rod protein FlgB [Syntrophomonadaceae bacterium]